MCSIGSAHWNKFPSEQYFHFCNGHKKKTQTNNDTQHTIDEENGSVLPKKINKNKYAPFKEEEKIITNNIATSEHVYVCVFACVYIVKEERIYWSDENFSIVNKRDNELKPTTGT